MLLGVPVAGAFDADEVRRASAPTSPRWSPASRAWAASAPPPDGANKEERAAQAENLRKMLLAMVEDIRVVLIKLAERTQALRTLMSGDAQWRARTAREVLDLFAPLANRLGVWQLKWELEDLSLRALEPATYKSIAQAARRAPARSRALHRGGGRARCARSSPTPASRPKSRAGRSTSTASGPRCSASRRASTRSTTSAPCASWSTSVKDCYTALGLVHHRWTPLAREFDDYIAKPKANNYRSLHTAVIGPEGKPLEVQIRTREMHQHSEYGVASHWRYKEGGRKGGAARSDVRREDRVAAPGARLEGHGRRLERVARRRSRKASSPMRSTC